jgi:hypothetical protein
MSESLVYVYCISEHSAEDLDGLAMDEISVLELPLFRVYYKNVPASEFSEVNLSANLHNIQWLDFNARKHVEVINDIMLATGVIPFNFGTIFHTEENLRQFITDYQDAFKENFDIVRGKEEWSVKIFSDTRALCHRIDELSEPAAALEKEIMASSPGKAFLLKRKKTELVENEMARLCKFYGQQYYNTFERLSESVFLNNLQPKELTGRTDNMILNASFLIVKSKVKEFQDCAGKLIGEAGSLGFNIEISGPWPPFSFVAVK